MAEVHRPVLVIAPNSFSPIGVTSLEAPFQVCTRSGNLASLANLHKLFHAGDGTVVLDDGMKSINPMAGYYLESFLKQRGYEAVALFDWNAANLDVALRRDPVAIAFSTTFVVSPEMLAACLRTLRDRAPGIPIIVGGPYVWKQRQALERLSPALAAELREFDVDAYHDILFSDDADAALREAVYVASEFGEHTLLAVLEALEKGRGDFGELARIPNLVLPVNGTWHATELVPEPVDIETHYTRWDLLDSIPDMVPMRASVGCPFRCRFCDYIELHPTVVMRSPESLLAEIRLAKQRGRTLFNFVDDNIFLNNKRIRDLAGTIVEHEMDILWGGFFRVDRIHEDNVDLIYESGCRFGYCGIESADDAMLKRMQKGCRQEEIFRGITLANSRGINTMLTFIVGFPGETRRSLDATAAFINRLDMGHRAHPTFHVYPLYVSPITSLDSVEFRRQWHLRGRYIDWSHSTMTYEDAQSTWCPYLFKQVKDVPYDHYGNDSADWLPVERRNRVFRRRNEIARAFLDGAPDARVQTAFEQLYADLTGDDVAAAPSWRDYLAEPQRQPGSRRVSLQPDTARSPAPEVLGSTGREPGASVELLPTSRRPA